MQQAGLSPYVVLLSGTRRVGEYLRKNVGTVAVGSEADLILLDANPLEDVRNVRKQAVVTLRGRWFVHSELEGMLQSIHIYLGIIVRATQKRPPSQSEKWRGQSSKSASASR